MVEKKEIEEYIRNNFSSRGDILETSTILVYSILALLTIIAQLSSLDPYRYSGFKNIVSPPIEISADAIGQDRTTRDSTPILLRGGGSINKDKSLLNPFKSVRKLFSQPTISKQTEAGRTAKVVTSVSSAKTEKGVVNSEADSSSSSESKVLLDLILPKDETQITRVVMFVDDSNVGIMGKIVGVKELDKIKDILTQPLSNLTEPLSSIGEKLPEKPIRLVFYTEKGYKEIEKNFKQVVGKDGVACMIGTIGTYDQVKKHSGNGLHADHAETTELIIKLGFPVKRGNGICVLTTSQFNHYRQKTEFADTDIIWADADQVNSEDGSIRKFFELRRQDYKKFSNETFLNETNRKKLLVAKESVENLGISFSHFLENHDYGVMQSHEQLVKSIEGTCTPMPNGTTGAVVQSYELAHNARKPLSEIGKGLSLENRESLKKLIVACNNASDIAERVSQCRNHYQRYPRCAFHLDGELMRLRADVESTKWKVLDRCVDEQTRTAAMKFVEDTIKSVDNSINSKVITTPMDELHDHARKRDQIHIAKGHHGNVSARGFKIDKYRLKKLDETIDQFFSGKSYTIGETAQHQNKKVESYPLNNFKEQHWQDFSLSLDSTEVVEKKEEIKKNKIEEPTPNFAEEQNLAAEMESAEELNSAAKSDWPYEEASEALPGHNSVGEPDWAFGKNSKDLKSHPVDDMTDDQDMESAADQKLFAELKLLEESKRNELDKKRKGNS